MASISPDLGVLIQELLTDNHRQHGDRGPRMPVLCTTKNLNLRQVPKALKAQYELHLSADSFHYHVEHYTVAASLISPRTGKLLHLSPMRLRHTLGQGTLSRGLPQSCCPSCSITLTRPAHCITSNRRVTW